jgi:hypothetical protein
MESTYFDVILLPCQNDDWMEELQQLKAQQITVMSFGILPRSSLNNPMS